MRILATLGSLKRAIAYFIGIRPRVLFQKVKSGRSYKMAQAKARAFYFSRALKEGRFQNIPAFAKQNFKNIAKLVPDDFRAALHPVVDGPQVYRQGKIKYSMIHRVAVRNFLAALSSTESYEIVGELDRINTTHSSYIDSVDLSLV